MSRPNSFIVFLAVFATVSLALKPQHSAVEKPVHQKVEVYRDDDAPQPQMDKKLLKPVVHGASEVPAAMLVRREPDADTPSEAAAQEAASQGVDVVIADGKADIIDCDPSTAAMLEDPAKAGTIKDHGTEDEGPCSKLKGRLTPAIAFGHVVIKEPDGNTSQVPDETGEEDSEIVKLVNKSRKYLWAMAYSLLATCAVCTFLGIIGQRIAKNAEAASVIKKREAEEFANLSFETEEDRQAYIREMVAQGASAGNINFVANAPLRSELEAQALAALPDALQASLQPPADI